MAVENFKAANFKAIPQDSQLTCWAACAAMMASAKAGKYVWEEEALKPYPTYLAGFQAKKFPNAAGIKDLYCTLMGLTEGKIELNNRRTLADFIKRKAPFIVSSSLVVQSGGSVTHLGYHLRMVTGLYGDADSSKEDDFQVRVFDPFPSPGILAETGFLFSHFKYQMTLKTGPFPDNVGKIFYRP